MIIKHQEAVVQMFEACHDGVGSVVCRELFADYANSIGIKFVHDDVLEPSVSIGPHTHRGDEEVYLILEGVGVMTVDGEEQPVQAGDMCLTRDATPIACATRPRCRFGCWWSARVLACRNVP